MLAKEEGGGALLVEIGELSAFPERMGRRVRAKDTELAVFRLSDGRMFALENRHPNAKKHPGSLAEGIVSGEFLYDPLYDWKIRLTDGVVQAPDEGRVRTFPLVVKDGKVYAAGE
ncbi:nitrite reductase [Paenibacillus antri]|uniref:Nitrite reductase n=1 Tax=Paenibacillus antri TaxID=2582848 RepID=A0A5R9GD21_9BACL|nr:nitrite reductase (NAD(P)H) small subunit [Paenibacillus antri]TLS49275.1 nitrite reductase [Paenibacillus antri]